MSRLAAAAIVPAALAVLLLDVASGRLATFREVFDQDDLNERQQYQERENDDEDEREDVVWPVSEPGKRQPDVRAPGRLALRDHPQSVFAIAAQRQRFGCGFFLNPD